MRKAVCYNNDDLSITVGDKTYSVEVRATGTWYYQKATRVDPEESELTIGDVETTWIDENGNIVDETPEMYDVLEEYLLESDDWSEEEYEPDYDYYEERAMARWERQLDRYDL